MTITVGADPEFWLFDGDHDYGAIVPSVGIIPGTKQAPYDLGDGYFCHEDNVTIELGVPFTNEGSMLGHIIKEGKNRIKTAFFKDTAKDLLLADKVEFRIEDLQSKQAKSFGCEPDFDAYTGGKMRDVPDSLIRGTTRYAGGHIHIGCTPNCPPFVVALFADLYLSVYMNSFAPHRESPGNPRSLYYGRPGVFRPKDYGIEYRTPSNWWCGSVKNGNQIGYMATRLGVYLEETTATTLRETIKKIDWNRVREAVNPDAGTGNSVIREFADSLLEDVRAVGVTI